MLPQFTIESELMNVTPGKYLLELHLLGLLLSMGLLAFPVDGNACHRGAPHGKDADCGGPPPPPPANEVTLSISYEFGTLDGSGDCTSPACVSTTVEAQGSVECGTTSCRFESTSVNQVFGLPASLRDLLFATEWRGTPLDPDNCFGSSDSNPAGGALIDNTILSLQRYNDGTTPWWASVGTRAFAIDGTEVRQHVFNFEGCGAGGNCGAFADGSMAGNYEGGELHSIYSHGNDRKFESIPCRCTKSNTPDCPDVVPSPTPQIRMTVSELP